MLTAWLASCALCAVAAGYYVPPQVDPWGPSKTPLHHMVDVTNEFGLKVLNEHNFFNEDNIAFSPYGLSGILVALYEGVDGDSSFQILESVRFPWNKDIMRVGFRDIHRTLKTYFIPVEGFLTGLALNNENVTFKETYTRILDFYGFDFKPKPMPDYEEDTPMLPTQVTAYPTPAATENSTGTATFSPSTTVSPFSTTITSLSPTSSTRDSSPTSEVSNGTSTAATTSTSTTTTTTTTTPTPEIATTSTTTTTTQTNPPSTATTSRPTTTEATTQDQPETTEIVTTNVSNDANNTTALSPSTIVTMEPSTDAVENTTAPSSTMPIAADTTTDVNADDIQTEMNVTNSSIQESSTNAMTSNMEMTTSPGPNVTESPTMSIATVIMSSTNQVTTNEDATVAMSSTSESSSPETSNSTETTTVQVTEISTTLEASGTETSTIVENSTNDATDIPSTTTESQVEIISISTTPNSGDNMGTNGSTIETLDRKKRAFRDISGIPPIIQEEFVFHYPRAMRLESRAHSFYGETMFLANGLKRVAVSYMTYDAIMEHAYLPYLKASALKLPLDSDKYYLLVILPEYDFPLDALIKRLAHLSNLRDIFNSLRPKYVHACVPSFMIKGHVSLTTDLQRLGIREVFEPRQNDFTPMTDNKGVYVRNVEQAITVTIRKYSSGDPIERRYVPNQAPVQFGATYPFLYFVMDGTVNVALMAGKMMDPLNSRIL